MTKTHARVTCTFALVAALSGCEGSGIDLMLKETAALEAEYAYDRALRQDIIRLGGIPSDVPNRGTYSSDLPSYGIYRADPITGWPGLTPTWVVRPVP